MSHGIVALAGTFFCTDVETIILLVMMLAVITMMMQTWAVGEGRGWAAR